MKYQKILFLAILIFNCQFTLAQTTEPSEQKKAEFYNQLTTARISAINQKGVVVLRDYNPGKITVVIFIAAWCKPCIDQAVEMKKLQAAIGKDKLRIVGVNADLDADEKTALRVVARRHKFNYLIGWTEDKLGESLMDLTKFSGIPQTVIVYDNEIKGFFLGGSKAENGKIRETIKTIIDEK